MCDCNALAVDRDEIEGRLRQELRGRIHDFRVEVREGGLILTGRCASYHSKQLAQHAVMAATASPILANRIEVRVGRD